MARCSGTGPGRSPRSRRAPVACLPGSRRAPDLRSATGAWSSWPSPRGQRRTVVRGRMGGYWSRTARTNSRSATTCPGRARGSSAAGRDRRPAARSSLASPVSASSPSRAWESRRARAAALAWLGVGKLGEVAVSLRVRAGSRGPGAADDRRWCGTPEAGSFSVQMPDRPPASAWCPCQKPWRTCLPGCVRRARAAPA